MPGNQNKLSRFWRELKRRRVVHTVTIYASVAWVIIQLVNNIIEPLNLPPALATIVILALIVGFPLIIILSWIYDLTGEGIERTKPLEELSDDVKLQVPNAWKIATYVSFIVIIGLIVLNIMNHNRDIRPGEIKSVLVLPFENYTGADSLDYFAAGMHSSLINDIGRINGLRVVNQTTSKSYANANIPLYEIAAKANVDAVIEGDITCLGDSLCTGIRLIKASPDEELIWMADYTEERSEIVNFYKKVTKQFADEVNIELSPETEHYLAESRKVVPEAYNAYLKGMQFWERLGEDNMRLSREYFEKAIKIDPNWADPYAGLAMATAYSSMGPDSIEKIMADLEKALELDPNSAQAHFVKGLFSVWPGFDWELGERQFLKSLAINPNNALCRVYYAHLLLILRRTDEAVTQANLALELDPERPLVLALNGEVINYTGNHQRVIEQCKKALAIDPENTFAPSTLALTYLYVGDTLKWYEVSKKALNLEMFLDSPDSIFKEKGKKGLIKAMIGVMEPLSDKGDVCIPWILAKWYVDIEEYDKAMDYYELAYERGYCAFLAYVGIDYLDYPGLKDNPRYIALLKKMKLPLPDD